MDSLENLREHLRAVPGGAAIDIPRGSRVEIACDVFDMPTESNAVRKVPGTFLYVTVTAPDGGVRTWLREDDNSPFRERV